MTLLPNFNSKLFSTGETVAVALSGGEDSVCLFHQLRLNADALGIRVKAVNVEHGLRGASSVADSAFVKALCDNFGVELYSKSVDSRTYSRTYALSEEEAARLLRYKVFDEAIASGFCDKIATAHHLADNAETVLFNLFRGGAAISGISETSRGGKIIRPMLRVSKEDIRAFLSSGGFDFVTDETNADEKYTRNFLRLRVMPLIKQKFPKAEEAVSRLTEINERESEYLNALAGGYIAKNGGEISVSSSCPDVLFARACAIAMKAAGIVKDYEKRHIDLLIGLKSAKNGTTIDLIGGVKAACDYGRITLYVPQKTSGEVCLPFCEGETKTGEARIAIEKFDGELKAGELYFDGDKIPQNAVIRTRKEGDVFRKFGGKSKKLKDYLIDKKIPARERDKLLLLADGKNVLIIFGIEISDDIRVDNGTRKVLKCSISTT